MDIFVNKTIFDGFYFNFLTTQQTDTVLNTNRALHCYLMID